MGALGSSGGCGSAPVEGEGYVPDVLNYIACQTDRILDAADALKGEALAAIEDLTVNANKAMDSISNATDYKADTGGVPDDYGPYTGPIPVEPDFSYVVPSPPQIPNPNEPLVTACEYDATFNRAKQKITKVNRKERFEALYATSRLGIGMAQPSLNAALQTADYESAGRTVEAALEQTVTEANHRREDRRDLLNLSAQVYQATAQGATSYLNAETQRYTARMEQLKVHIQSEAERRGWSEMQLKVILEKADKESEYALEKAKAIAAAMESADQAVAQFLSAMAQGLYSAASLGLSGGANTNESFSTNQSI
jgi:hypothetical protein